MVKKNGFSLTGVLIASGVGALIFGFIADMIIYQYKEQKHLSQKLEMTDLANTLINTFAKPGNCSCQFINNATNPNLANFGALHFDSTNVTGTESISVNKLFSGCLGGANPPILLAANNQPLHGSQDLIVDTVKLVNLKPSGGGANPNDWQGQWQVIFKVALGSLNKPSPPVMVTQKFTIDPTIPTMALISSCNGISSGTGTTNYLAKWSGITGMLMDSGVYEEPLLKKIGIGTTIPDDTLEVVFGAGRGITSTKFGQVGAAGGAVQVRGARGTQAAPSALLANDYLGWFYGEGHNGTGFTSHASPTSMAIQATENWNVTNNGSRLSFFTIPNGTASGIERMTVQENGNVGIGTTLPLSSLHVSGASMRIDRSSITAVSGPALDFFTGVTHLAQVVPVSDGVDGASLRFYTKLDGGVLGAPKMSISNNGNVGIGTAAPGFKLEVQGTAYAVGAAGALSDSRHKKGILPLSDEVLDQVLRLNPVKFEWKNPKDKGMQGTQMGFVAQEVQQLFPSMILTSSNEEKTLGIKYNELTAIFVKAFQQFFQLWMNDVEKKTDDILLVHSALDKMRTELEQTKRDNLILKNYICSKDPKAIFCNGH